MHLQSSPNAYLHPVKISRRVFSKLRYHRRSWAVPLCRFLDYGSLFRVGVLLSPDTGDLSTIDVANIIIIIILAVLTTRQHVAILGYRLYVIMQ